MNARQAGCSEGGSGDAALRSAPGSGLIDTKAMVAARNDKTLRVAFCSVEDQAAGITRSPMEERVKAVQDFGSQTRGARQVVGGAFDDQKIGGGGDQGDGFAQFFGGSEGVGGTVDEEDRSAEIGQVRRPLLFGLVGWMERVGEQQQGI